MYLLDTNHCSRLLQGHPQLVKKLSTIDNTLVATCVIVQGELVFMAQRSARQAENLRNVKSFLQKIRAGAETKAQAEAEARAKAEARIAELEARLYEIKKGTDQA